MTMSIGVCPSCKMVQHSARSRPGSASHGLWHVDEIKQGMRRHTTAKVRSTALSDLVCLWSQLRAVPAARKRVRHRHPRAQERLCQVASSCETARAKRGRESAGGRAWERERERC